MMELFNQIREHVISSPEMIVLSALGEDKEISFRELDRISGKVYRYLHEHGIGREDFVNILLPRGVEPFIAMLGVWKAGAAFVLLEEGYSDICHFTDKLHDIFEKKYHVIFVFLPSC